MHARFTPGAQAWRSRVTHRGPKLKDQLSGGRHNLRFPERLWEAEWFASAGFYTNRLPCGQMLDLMASAGFEVKVTRKETWERLPIDHRKLGQAHRGVPMTELLVSGFDVVLRKA